jgi:hypothetical protein
MKKILDTQPKRSRSLFGASLTSLLLAVSMTACGGSSPSGGSSGTSVGSEHANPDGTGWFTEANFGGSASKLYITDVFWGRLVNVFDGNGNLRHRDYLIGEDIRSDGVDYQLDINAVTEQASLTILHPHGTGLYTLAFDRLDQNLGPILPKSDSGSAPPFSFVPRNATIGVRFSDLIKPGTINSSTLKLLVGNPPELPFEARLTVDPNYGDTVGGVFYPTRVLLDTTVSELEAGESLLPLNSLGLPPSKTTALPNVSLRIPSILDFSTGQFQVLTNLVGNGLSSSGNGPVDFSLPTKEVIRAMRSGGDALTTGDTNNGFLLDLNAPQIVGSQPVTILSVVADVSGGPGDYVVSFEYASLACAAAIEIGDVLSLPGVFAEATAPSSPPSLGLLADVRVKLLAGDPIDFHTGSGQVLSTFDKAGGDFSDCFMTFSPLATSLPSTGVSPDAHMVVRFSEPMDPSSVRPFDTFTVTRLSTNPGITGFVVGDISPSADLKEFRFIPSLPLAHSQGSGESYFMNLLDGEFGLTDLAGNALSESLDQVVFDMKVDAATERNGSIVLRFNNPNEDGDFLGTVPLTEYAGQFLLDPIRGLIRARPVERTAAVADRSQAVPSIMIALPAGVQTPLSPLGSRMMDVYRYFDVGLSVTDSSGYNMDIEGLNWAPLAGQLQADFFEEFEINLSHCLKMPDEQRNSALLPAKPTSGLLSSTFAENILPDPAATGDSVHPKALGYLIDPAELFIGASGAKFMPYPMNRNLPVSEFAYFTWRDTSVQAVGGVSSFGVPAAIEAVVGLTSTADTGTVAGQGNVPTIGLPLLMEFKCYPSDTGIGLNSLDCAIAINSSSKPTFRIFSTGGYDPGGNPIIKNPDTQPGPSGGYNQSSTSGLPIGAPTPKQDNVFYFGQLDLVIRVSRSYTRWLDTDESNPDFLSPVLEPRPSEQPSGSQLVLAYRGSTAIGTVTDKSKDPLLNASSLDAYGDELHAGAPPAPAPIQYGATVSKNPHINGFLQQDPVSKIAPWQDSVDSVDGGQYIQVRFSLIGNTETGLTPELSAFGLAYLRNS